MKVFVRELLSAFGARFVFVVGSVYGVSQGVGSNWMSPAVSFLLLHDMQLHPYVAQGITTVARLPWSIKVVYGLLSDRVPLWRGRRRGPYLVLSALTGIACWLTLLSRDAVSSLRALTMVLIGGYASVAVADVVVDASVAERSKALPALGPSLQSLSWGSYAVGGLVGSLSSGFLIASWGARTVLTALAIPAAFVLTSVAIAAVTLSTQDEIARGAATVACAVLLCICVYFGMRRLPGVEHAETLARVAIYIFAREAVVPSVDAAMFSWYTMAEDGPHFSITFLGFLSTVSLVAMLGGVALYQRFLKGHSYRALFVGSHALLSCCALFDVAFVLHANRAIGIPDRAFALGDTAFSPIVGRLSLMPMFALAAKLCPSGTEATLYALLMSLSNFGVDVSSYAGSVLLWMVGEEGEGLRNALIVRAVCRLLPIPLVFALVPRGSPITSE